MSRSRFKLAVATAAAWIGLVSTAILATPPAAAADHDLLVANSGGTSVLRFDGSTGQFLSTFIGEGKGGLSDLQGITLGADGNLYAASGGTASVKRYDG